MPVEKFSVSLMPDTYAQVERRAEPGGRSTAINHDLSRYYSLMAQARRRLRDMLSDDEAGLILDAFNGSLFRDDLSLRLAWATIQDAIEIDGLDAKWQVDGAALVSKVKQLDAAGVVALVDAAEMWWNRVGYHSEQPKFAEMFD